MSFHAKLRTRSSIAHAATTMVSSAPATPPAPAPARVVREGFALVRGVDTAAMARMVWERGVRRRKVLVSIDDVPQHLTSFQKLLLSCADGVLASPDMVGALADLGIATNRVVTLGQPFDRSVFMACPRTRTGGDAFRIIYVGDLSPSSGVAEFLACAIGWAERNPAVGIEIAWLGRGDLLGVLHAQLLPPNLTQRFADIPARPDLAAEFARSGLLVVPSLSHVRSPYITEAMAAGLPVLGSIRSAQVRGLVAQHVTGWLFDPLWPEDMAAALDAVFATTPGRLDEMRGDARARIMALHSERLGDGVDQALRAKLVDLLVDNAPVQA